MAGNRWLVEIKLEQLGDDEWSCGLQIAEADESWTKSGAVRGPDEIEDRRWPSPVEPLVIGTEWIVHEIFPPNLELGEDPQNWTEPGIEIYRDRLYTMCPRLREVEGLTASWLRDSSSETG